MDNRNSLFSKTVQLACRVLQEQIQNKDSKTQLEREFLEAMGLNTQKPTQDMGEDSLPSSDPDLATPRFSYGTSSDGPAEQPDRHQGFFPGKNKKELRDQLEKVKTERDEARKQINESQKNERILQQENSELRGELSSARKRIENLEHQLRLQQSMLPEQDQQQLTALQDGIDLQIKELRHRLTGIIFKCRRLINRKNSRLPAFRAVTRLYTACIDMSFLQNFLLFSFTFCYHLRPFSAS